MKSTVKFFGIVAAVAMVGFTVAGCATLVPADRYFNLGDASEEGDYALVEVSAVLSAGVGSHDYSVPYRVMIDGQGAWPEWAEEVGMFVSGKSFVRVTPGSHTLTMFFKFGEKEIPVDVTADFQAGMGYMGGLTATDAGLNVVAEADVTEYTINEKGKFALLGTDVGSNTETFGKLALSLR